MKIKSLVIVLLFSLAVSSKAHAFGFGLQANMRAGEVFAPGASLLISPNNYLHLAFNWYVDFDSINTVGLTLDVVPVQLQIVPIGRDGGFNFTLGVGMFANSTFAEEDTIITGGARIPIGFNILFTKNLEFFTHVAPSFGVDMLPSIEFSKPFYPIALGIRLWIR